MAFLIIEKTVADQLFVAEVHPNDRELLLAKIDEITVDGTGPNWGQATFSLRSLTTVPIILLAGYIAASRKHNVHDLAFQEKFPAIVQAMQFCYSYVSQFGGDDLPDSDRHAKGLFDQHWEFAGKAIAANWTVVEIVAAELLNERTLPLAKAFMIVRQNTRVLHD